MRFDWDAAKNKTNIVLKIALWPVSDRASYVFMGRGACPV
jgi:hypothetical protein